MAWTGIARREHSREGMRYPSDLTDREWMLASPFIPPSKTGGRWRATDIHLHGDAVLGDGTGKSRGDDVRIAIGHSPNLWRQQG